MAQAEKRSMETAETVLLRHPMPKYNFQGRKLPKETPALGAAVKDSDTYPAPVPQHASMSALGTSKQTANTVLLPNCGTVPASGTNRKSAAVRPFSSSVKSDDQVTAVTKPMAAVVAPNMQRSAGLEKLGSAKRNESDDFCERETTRATPAAVVKGKKTETPMTYLPNVTENDIPVPDAALLAHTVEGPNLEEKLEKAEKEITMLRSQLEVQLQVNAEVKRLLVASVGEDFERKVEGLARDRAQLAMELGDFTKKMTEDYENLDQISIQADMWRSKYLASRVMVEELASARAFYSSQFQDSQQAIQELMNERYELRTGLVQSYKCLQQVKEAFDPFNAQKSHNLPSTNVLDLAKHIKQLSEAVRFRLLPAHAGSHVMMPLEESWENTMTQAELSAYNQLSKQSTPPSFKHSIPSTPVLTTSKSYERFHPLTRHDNITINCCSHCKGEIKIA